MFIAILDGESICDSFDSAIFYSISSLETGLRGIDLGHRLIISACEQMANDETTINLKHFSSLSPGIHFLTISISEITLLLQCQVSGGG